MEQHSKTVHNLTTVSFEEKEECVRGDKEGAADHNILRNPENNDKLYYCPDCGERFSDIASLSRHAVEQNHAGVSESCWICGLCNSAFLEEHQLTKHMVTHKVHFISNLLPSDSSRQVNEQLVCVNKRQRKNNYNTIGSVDLQFSKNLEHSQKFVNEEKCPEEKYKAMTSQPSRVAPVMVDTGWLKQSSTVTSTDLVNNSDLNVTSNTGSCAVSVPSLTHALGLFLFTRIVKAGKDRRFDKTRANPVRFFYAWTLQGVWVLVTILPSLLAVLSPRQRPVGTRDYIGWGIWAMGFLIEVVADYQKTVFKNNPANKDKFINTGLWALSRHPNYFGEILLWFGLYVSASSTFSGWEYLTTSLHEVYKSKLVSVLQSSTETRLNKFESMEVFQLAATLDPRYKLDWSHDYDNEVQDIRDLLTVKYNMAHSVDPTTDTSPVEPPPMKRNKFFVLANRSSTPRPTPSLRSHSAMSTGRW
ncbi:Zinc finger protein 362-like [Homarus americanus]|uniref:Zinc finger protein 362-like n=1 Tax=Homarus americanus TaxID=6706 RepID=A0A8J5MJJ4_HOMAM|nr:Zinc finger protein 362-like [Homarus americanus]